jgi:hypothetical protein
MTARAYFRKHGLTDQLDAVAHRAMTRLEADGRPDMASRVARLVGDRRAEARAEMGA